MSGLQIGIFLNTLIENPINYVLSWKLKTKFQTLIKLMFILNQTNLLMAEFTVNDNSCYK